MKTNLLALMTVVLAPAAYAADLEVTDAQTEENEEVTPQACRPTIACMAEIVPAGYFQVEAGYGGRSAGGFEHSAQLLLMYSVLDHLQLQLGTNYVFLAGQGVAARAFDGVMPGLKWKINDQAGWVPSNALSVHLNLPTQAFPDAMQKTFDLQAWWYLSKDLWRFHADYNLMLSVYDLGGKPIPQGLSTVAVAFTINDWLSVYTELYSTFGNAQDVALDGGSLNGIAISPFPGIVFDVGADIGLYQQTRAFTIFAGVAFVPANKRLSPLVKKAPGVGNNALALGR